MKNKLIILSTLVLSTSACDMYNPNNKPDNNLAPGNYERTLTSTNSAGTETVKKVSTDVSIDSDGNKKTVVESKVTKDPKGLMNKTTLSKSKDVVAEDNETTTTTHEYEENKSSKY